MSQRPVDTGPDPTPSATVASGSSSRAMQRHCWVRSVDGAQKAHPGLLVEWRQQPSGQWQALVVYAVEDAGAVTLVQQWLEAGLLAPA